MLISSIDDKGIISSVMGNNNKIYNVNHDFHIFVDNEFIIYWSFFSLRYYEGIKRLIERLIFIEFQKDVLHFLKGLFNVLLFVIQAVLLFVFNFLEILSLTNEHHLFFFN